MTARRARPVAGRAGWGLIDQVFSSLTNFALGIVVARTVPIAEFGAFSLAFAAYLLAVNMTRAFPMQPLAIRYSAIGGGRLAARECGGTRDCAAGRV